MAVTLAGWHAPEHCNARGWTGSHALLPIDPFAAEGRPVPLTTKNAAGFRVANGARIAFSAA